MRVRYGGEVREKDAMKVGVGNEGDPSMTKTEVPSAKKEESSLGM